MIYAETCNHKFTRTDVYHDHINRTYKYLVRCSGCLKEECWNANEKEVAWINTEGLKNRAQRFNKQYRRWEYDQILHAELIFKALFPQNNEIDWSFIP